MIVTSDKVYENHGAGRPFVEEDRLGGHDPYSNSKACAELVTGSFRDSFFINGPPIASVRAGNVIGGGDWSPDRLIPDCVRALKTGRPVTLRYPDAVQTMAARARAFVRLPRDGAGARAKRRKRRREPSISAPTRLLLLGT